MTNHITPEEQGEINQINLALAAIEAQAAPLKARKATILSRIRFRAHYQRQKASEQS